MIEIRPFAGLGAANHGWLDARHHFAFGGYRDVTRMGWGSLRVWNDDSIAARSGFPPHPHSDMEIITYVRQGAITHTDSLGNEGRTGAGDVQVMSAGNGITHSEYNPEPEATRIFQSWIQPTSQGARLAGATLRAGKSTSYRLGHGRHLYLVSPSGTIEGEGQRAEADDGVAVSSFASIRVSAVDDAEIVLVDA
ncbi:pirin family protein [Lichenicola sp.]|uniref:pirin family protein n=1 Tax=Lichenicola sp. TaxID=2804529 RepID=UPI003B00914A